MNEQLDATPRVDIGDHCGNRLERGEHVSGYFTNQHVAKQQVNIDFPLGSCDRSMRECQRVDMAEGVY